MIEWPGMVWPLSTSSYLQAPPPPPCSLCCSHTSFWLFLLSCSPYHMTPGPLLMLFPLSWIFFTSAHYELYFNLQSKHFFIREAFVTAQTYLHSFSHSAPNLPLQVLISECKYMTMFIFICCFFPPPHYEYKKVKVFVLLIKVSPALSRGCGIEEGQICISQLNQWPNGRGR